VDLDAALHVAEDEEQVHKREDVSLKDHRYHQDEQDELFKCNLHTLVETDLVLSVNGLL
jgi:hypothetical protein